MDPTKGFKVTALEGDAFAAAMGRLFGFAYVWALGGNLAPTCTEAYDEFVREHLQDVVIFPGTTLACWLAAVNVAVRHSEGTGISVSYFLASFAWLDSTACVQF
jgi:hypothetical protein